MKSKIFTFLFITSLVECQWVLPVWRVPLSGCPPNYQTNIFSPNVGCYRLIGPEMPFSTAENTCLLIGGYLASINNPEEQAFVDALTGNTPSWIGASLESDGRTIHYSDGKPLIYANFPPGEPSRSQGSCIVTSNTGWRTAPCLSWATGLCRVDKIIFQRNR